MQKNERKNQKFRQDDFGIFERRGGQGEAFPCKLFFQVSASGKVGKTEPVREHRQCLLFFPGKSLRLSGIAGKNRNFFGKCPHRGDITLFTINIRNSGERGWENDRPCIPAAQGD